LVDGSIHPAMAGVFVRFTENEPSDLPRRRDGERIAEIGKQSGVGRSFCKGRASGGGD
jgi:hypothetical protein